MFVVKYMAIHLSHTSQFSDLWKHYDLGRCESWKVLDLKAFCYGNFSYLKILRITKNRLEMMNTRHLAGSPSFQIFCFLALTILFLALVLVFLINFSFPHLPPTRLILSCFFAFFETTILAKQIIDLQKSK